MKVLDSAAWQAIRFISFLQGTIYFLLAQNCSDGKKKFEYEVKSMSGFILSQSNPQDLPSEISAMLLLVGRFLLMLFIVLMISTIANKVYVGLI
jgi:hypothetical protein